MEFQKFPKIPRLSRDITITEKVDGSCGVIVIKDYSDLDVSDCQFIIKYALNLPEDFNEGTYQFLRETPYIFAGSKNRWLDISSKGDNYGFAKWVQENAEELLQLGEGKHYGEWFGRGINRGYGLDEKRFALFNVNKWHKFDQEKRLVSINPKTKKEKFTQSAPKCCEVVPILYQGDWFQYLDGDLEYAPNWQLKLLELHGSKLVPNFMNPEGIIIYHTVSGHLYKKTIVGDEKPKGLQ